MRPAGMQPFVDLIKNAYQNLTLTRNGLRIIGLEFGFDRDFKGSPMMEQATTPYDEFPYPGRPFAQSHPDRLATVGVLLGMQPADIETCRVLELGCGDGGNLLPMAAELPDSRFVGVDASQRHCDIGRRQAAALGLTNIELQHHDIRRLDPAAIGRFDYIIAHGVFSWVEESVRHSLWEICRQCLSPNGIAYISYNTFPGWHDGGRLREMLLYHVRNLSDVRSRIAQARAFLKFLAASVPAENTAYSNLLQQELRELQTADDWSLRYDLLGEINQPCYFHQFIAQAHVQHLQYLGEAEFHTMFPGEFSEAAADGLQRMASNVEEMEQNLDFLRNRSFRQTLLCHAAVAVQREVLPARFRSLCVSSNLQPVSERPDVSGPSDEQFRNARGETVTTNRPIAKTALLRLAQIWPQALPFDELLAEGRKLTRSGAIDAMQTQEAAASILAESLLTCYSRKLIELHVRPPALTAEIVSRPQASALARLQAESGPTVTSQRHQSVTLPALHRHVLRHLDGSRDSAALLQILTELALTGVLNVQHGRHPIRDRQQLQTLLTAQLPGCLKDLASAGLLIG
jgi:methyltransferase-like protein/2-polyprenyl-3-methyl-5-hydroxy-6-metoxy-1,4-benzoquinol methylase